MEQDVIDEGNLNSKITDNQKGWQRKKSKPKLHRDSGKVWLRGKHVSIAHSLF